MSPESAFPEVCVPLCFYGGVQPGYRGGVPHLFPTPPPNKSTLVVSFSVVDSLPGDYQPMIAFSNSKWFQEVFLWNKYAILARANSIWLDKDTPEVVTPSEVGPLSLFNGLNMPSWPPSEGCPCLMDWQEPTSPRGRGLSPPPLPPQREGGEGTGAHHCPQGKWAPEVCTRPTAWQELNSPGGVSAPSPPQGKLPLSFSSESGPLDVTPALNRIFENYTTHPGSCHLTISVGQGPLTTSRGMTTSRGGGGIS